MSILDAYLMGPYLMGPYLYANAATSLRTQVSLKVFNAVEKIHSQMRLVPQGKKKVRAQFKGKVNGAKTVGGQFQMTNLKVIRAQYLAALYNTKLFRVLWKFPSRGNDGETWTVSLGGTASGDFGVNNLNTDIVEQVYRSTGTSVILQCDTQVAQGIFNDTVAILGHNITVSASVTMQASNDPSFSTTEYSEALAVTTEDIYWVSPTLPSTPYRYWRFVINDPTNPSGYIQIGTIVFGSALIFHGECFVDTLQRSKVHFADKVETEGFTNVSNDRALKKKISLSFRSMEEDRANYKNLSEAVDTVRTSLKALWIPDPQRMRGYAVFAKLAEMPDETINYKAIGYIDLDLNMDESL